MPVPVAGGQPRARVAVLAFALAFAMSARASAQTVDSSLLSLLHWRLIGPSRGGRVEAVAGDPRDRLTFYMGATGGGVWKTTDGGITWKNISDGYFRTGSVGALALAPSSPDVIYVGMGEACFRGDASEGDGVYRSTDAGKTWTHLGLDATKQIARVRVDPRNPDVAFVAAFGDGFGPSPERGVFKTTDGGKTWRKVLYRDENTGAIDLVMDPSHPDVLYASLLQFRRYPWAVQSAGPGTGLFKSTDGGEHWTELTKNPGFPTGILGRIGVAMTPANPERVWAIVDAELGKKGVYRSDDGGAHWERLTDFAELTQRPWYYHHIFADPKNADVVYVLNIGAWKSTDGGRTFVAWRPPHGDHHDLWIDAADPQRMVEGNDGGATVSFNGGQSWSTLMNQPTAQLYHVTTDDQFPYRIYGPQQDEGSISLPSRSDFGSITEQEWEFAAGGESGYIAVRPDDPTIVYGAEHHWLERYDLKNHQKRDISPYPENYYGWGDRDIRYRFQWTYPVALSPHDPRTLYAGAQVLFRSTDEGQSWQVISPDLTRHDPDKLEPTPAYGNEKPGKYWGPITRDNTGVEWYSVIFGFAESPVTAGVLWTGSDDGLVHVSRDGGRTWTNVTPRGLPPYALISIIEPGHRDAGTAYLAATRYKLQDNRPYLFRTTDYGRTWTEITSGIPAGDFTRVIREDPTHPGLLYAGTETGVYFSGDDGAHWQSLRMNLPVVPVHDLVVKNGDLVAGTHGRSIWILDQAGHLLPQLPIGVSSPSPSPSPSPAVPNPNSIPNPSPAVQLFAPAPAVRFRGDAALVGSSAAAGTDGQNPPNGVVVQWYATSKPTGPVSLTFLDSSGNTIRGFSSDSSGSGSGSGSRSGGRRGAGTPMVVRALQGANTFVWDMRYPAANVIPGTTLHGVARGPLAVPGAYQVRLAADGQTYTRPFQILKDPRVTYDVAALAQQRDFELQVRDEVTRTHDLVRKIRSMRTDAEKQLAAAKGTPDEARLTAALKALNDRLYPIEERLSQYRARAEQDLTNYPNGLDDKLVFLLSAADQADAPPTAGEVQLLKDLSDRVDERAAALTAVEKAQWMPFAPGSATSLR